MDLTNYLKSFEKIHKKKIQTGFEKHDRLNFIDEILGQMGYSRDNIYFDVPQKERTPDLRIYGNSEKKSKNTMSRFVIETKNYGLLEKNINNIDFLQLKNYVRNNSGKIKYIASTDYISFFLFNAEVLLNENKLNLDILPITKAEIVGFKSVLVYKFDFTDFSKLDEQKFEMLSHKNLFEIYDFPHPEKNADRFNIQKRAVRENFIKSLYYLTVEIKDDILIKFMKIFNTFLEEYHKIENLDDETFGNQFQILCNRECWMWIRNLFFWAIEMNYIQNFIQHPNLLDKKEIEKILLKKNPEGKEFYYNEYLVTCIYSVINKTLFIRILEDSGYRKGGNIFIKGEKEWRYLSNGIVQEKFLEGKLKQYISYVFDFRNPDLMKYSFLLKHEIYDWVITEIEEYILVDFLRVFNEIYLKELDQDILGDIYEHYLQEERDEIKGKSYRRLLGQYYTPRPIVRFMWFLVRDVLKQEKNIDVYNKNQNLLQILDPFVGSGTFLNEAVLQMKSAISGKSIMKGEVFYFFKDRTQARKIEESLTGFEINPLSCSIADINIYFRLIKSFSPDRLNSTPITNLNIFRTNSFDLTYRKNNNNNTLQLSLLSEEIKTTFTFDKKIKTAKTQTYDIIIANPPYGITKPTKFMKNELIPFAYPKYNFDKNYNEIDFNWQKIKNGKIPKNEQNRGKLRDMYAFAYGVADRLLNQEGIICFITSNTFLTLPTYKWMRKYWLRNYMIKYIINFNRIMEKTNSMFAPESSVATTIIVMIKKKTEDNYKIKYLDLSNLNSIKEKYDYFNYIEWKKPAKNKNDIQLFNTKKIEELKFSIYTRNEFLANPDYELIKIDPIVKMIEKDTDYLLNFGNFQLGIQTSNDKVFVGDNKRKILENIETYIKNEDLDYKVNEDKIEKYIEHQNLEKYGINGSKFIYYDKILEKLIHEKANKEERRASMWLRDENKLRKSYKLLIGAYYFYVDNKKYMLAQNCIDKKNLYFLNNNNEDILYYICGILNSYLGVFYRNKTQIDNYERFPIKNIKEHEQIFHYIVKEVKNIHKIKSDYLKLKNGKINFESDFFIKNISKRLKIYPIEEKNEYFNLNLPKGIGVKIFVNSPKISKENDRIIKLNEEGLELVCKNRDISKILFEHYFKDAYGDLNELDININITQMDDFKFNKIKNEISKKIRSIENTINILVYTLYFDIKIKYKNEKIFNEKEILSNKYVKNIEKNIK